MNPLLKQLVDIWDEIEREQRAQGVRRVVGDFEDRSGYNRQILSRWRRGRNSANLASIEAVANTLGYRLVLEKIPSEKSP